MSGEHLGANPVAIAQLNSPFSAVTFFSEAKTPGSVFFTYNQREAWTTLPSQQDLPAIPPPAQATSPFTVHFWWDPAASEIGWWYSNPGSSASFGSTNVKVVSSINLSASTTAAATSAQTTPAQSAPAETGPSGSPPPTSVTGAVASETSTSTNTPVTTATPPNGNGLSGGAVAGVAIGCLIAGALIASAIAWFCLGRRRKPAAKGDSESSALALMHREKGPTAKTMSLESGSPTAVALENGLPQPLEDKAITGEVAKISNAIKNHVQSYYHTRQVSAGMIDYDDLQALGGDLPVSVGTLSTLLGNSATREIALRFCIAWVVVSRMQLGSSPNTSFLPPEIAKCFLSMTFVDRGSRVHALYFSKWKSITAELMQSTYVRNPFTVTDDRLHNIQEAAGILDNVLRPYSDSRMEDGQRTRNLEEILKRAALFAFTLFSQPSSWNFDWQNETGVKSGSLCIFPALMQVMDENGEPVKPPRPFSEAVVRRLDE